MLTRRNFLKLGGISAAALGAGYSTGKLASPGSGCRFSVHGFIPADEQYIKRLAALFRKKVRSSSQAAIYGDPCVKRALQDYDNAAIAEGFSGKGTVVYRVQLLDHHLIPDIILSDDKNPLYVPEEDFSYSFLQLRNDMKNCQASYLFAAEYNEVNILNSLFSPEKRIVIENEKGIAEVLNAGGNFKDIVVDGAIGKTHVTLSGGIVRVSRSCCRNRICEHTLLSDPRGIIACAPNKIIIQFES